MVDRAELVEAALEVYQEGLALLDLEGRVVYWNRTAEEITGFTGVNLVGRNMPGSLQVLAQSTAEEQDALPLNGTRNGRGWLVHAQHQRGHDLPVVTRQTVLRDPMGARIGTAAIFSSAEHKSPLPHGHTSEGEEVRRSQAELEQKLEDEFDQFLRQGAPLGVLWISVDQASEMRKTHGAAACESMLENVERTIANALRAGEEVGRWGDDEFLVTSQDPNPETLGCRGQVLAGIARTADFHWWGDRISPSVSVGAAVAESNETLAGFLERAQTAMLESIHAGGNHVSVARRRQ